MLPSDLADAKRLIPQASLPWLASHLTGLNEEQQAAAVLAAEEILKQAPPAE